MIPLDPDDVRMIAKWAKKRGHHAVYAIGESSGDGALKIGHSSSVISRLGGLQHSTPLPLAIFGVWFFPDVSWARSAESQLHEILKSQGSHVRGEWFSTAPDVIEALIEKHYPQKYFLSGLKMMQSIADRRAMTLKLTDAYCADVASRRIDRFGLAMQSSGGPTG